MVMPTMRASPPQKPMTRLRSAPGGPGSMALGSRSGRGGASYRGRPAPASRPSRIELAQNGLVPEPPRRGRLTVFFGAAPGVGKTHAMLESAGEEAAAGRRVLAGVVETHGRAETAALLGGLEVLPRRRLA